LPFAAHAVVVTGGDGGRHARSSGEIWNVCRRDLHLAVDRMPPRSRWDDVNSCGTAVEDDASAKSCTNAILFLLSRSLLMPRLMHHAGQLSGFHEGEPWHAKITFCLSMVHTVSVPAVKGGREGTALIHHPHPLELGRPIITFDDQLHCKRACSGA
jgi:hypothetical protein